MQINILEYLKNEIICTFYYEECEDHAERSKAKRTESLLLLASERDRVFEFSSFHRIFGQTTTTLRN
jgi:hypothetical protein